MMQTACRIDHITVTAPTLEAGAEFVRQALGILPQAGGEHPRMGTHNLLLRLGDALFLEVISPNPKAAAPARPRWFGLDAMARDTAPSLATWVARTPDIRASIAACPEALGDIGVNKCVSPLQQRNAPPVWSPISIRRRACAGYRRGQLQDK
jgi:Glyoxalase-like domain